jgi:uncharacterized protein YdhG (YjbR/CyaY superfamily)
MPKYLTVDDYIGALPASAQKFAVELRETILAIAPNAVEEIRYDMPSFKTGKSTFVYFACWKSTLGSTQSTRAMKHLRWN